MYTRTYATFTVDFEWDTSWPLYILYPLSIIFFTSFYFLGPRIWPKTPIAAHYERWSVLNKACWRQNCCAMVHAVGVTVLLVAAIFSDPALRGNRPLHTYHNLVGYVALCFSLGYFSFVIPWTYHLYFCKGERHATNLPLVIHHGVVWFGSLTYIIGRTCSLYGAVAFACMEFTNWFFIIHVNLQMLRSKRRILRQVNYVLLVLAFAVCRLGICTWMGVLFFQDLLQFESDAPFEWALIIIQAMIFAFVWLLSWFFVYTELKTMLQPLLEQKLARWGMISPKPDQCRSKGLAKGTIPSVQPRTRQPGKPVAVASASKPATQSAENV